jgi:ABC-type Na+ efflux pump permease subunit
VSDNTYLSPVEAGLRAALVTAPPILNGSQYESAIWGGLLAVAIFGLPLSMLYLVALSNNKRQVLLHDLAFGTLVVRQRDRDLQRPPPLPAALWRGHFVVVSLILFASFLLGFTLSYFAPQ